MSLLHDDVRIGRRPFLKAAGISLSLPLMESLPGMARTRDTRDTRGTPVRLLCLFMPNGVHVPSWKPEVAGTDWKLTPTLAPLADLKQDVFVLTGLRNRNSYAGEGHYVKTTALLSGAKVKKTGGKDIRCGVSIDQFAAQHIGHLTPLPTLQLSIDPVSNLVDMGYSTIYGGHISWRTPTVPASREIHPQLAFDRLFRTAKLGDARNRLILDTVLGDAKRLAGRVAGADRDKIGEYLEAVHAVEKRVRNFAGQKAKDAREIEAGRRREDFDPVDHATKVRLMLEIFVLAFRADVTRLGTFMFGNSVSGRNFSFLDGVNGGFHHFSHHENKPEKQRQYALINRWHVEQYAWLLNELKGIEEDGMSLLDRSMVLCASGIGDGNRHDPKSLPVLLAGRAGGRLAPGRHLVFKEDRRLCSLHMSMLQGLGLRVPQFGDSDRTLPELFA